MSRHNLPTRRGWRVAVLCGVVAALGAGPGAGAGPDDPKGAEPTAEGVLRQVGDYYKGKAFRVRMDRETRIGPIAIPNVVNVAVERPNKLAIRTEGNGPGMDLISDGKTMTLAIAPIKKYVQNLAPESIAALFDEPVIQGILLNSLQGSMVAELISDDPYKSLMEGVTSAKYAGTDDISGGKAHHLKFTQDQFDWEVWVAADGDPLLLKASMDLAKTLADNPAARQQLKGQKYEVVHNFKSWRMGGPIPAKVFAFEPPAGMEKANSLEEAIGGAAGANGNRPGGDDDRKPRGDDDKDDDEAAASPLLGKPAPAVSLPRVGGGNFALADAVDKQVVILDFWATWCPPCVRELPVLAEVARDFAGKGVDFVAVNLRETAEQVREFQQDKKLEFAAALDKDGRVAEAYGVEGIPTLVVVDRQGVVRAVHIGYSDDLKETLTNELNALLAGKDLAVPAAPRPK